MNLRKVITLGISVCCLVLSVSCYSATSKSTSIYTAVDQSMSQIMPHGTSWNILIPSFMDKQELTAKNIHVEFGEQMNSDLVIATVWLNTQKGTKMYAIPVEIHSPDTLENQYKLSAAR